MEAKGVEESSPMKRGLKRAAQLFFEAVARLKRVPR